MESTCSSLRVGDKIPRDPVQRGPGSTGIQGPFLFRGDSYTSLQVSNLK